MRSTVGEQSSPASPQLHRSVRTTPGNWSVGHESLVKWVTIFGWVTWVTGHERWLIYIFGPYMTSHWNVWMWTAVLNCPRLSPTGRKPLSSKMSTDWWARGTLQNVLSPPDCPAQLGPASRDLPSAHHPCCACCADDDDDGLSSWRISDDRRGRLSKNSPIKSFPSVGSTRVGWVGLC